MITWLIRRAMFGGQVRRAAKQNGFTLRSRRHGWRFATLRTPGFDFELEKDGKRLLVKLADCPSRRFTYIFEDNQWLTIRHYHRFRGFGPTPYTDRLVDLSALRAEQNAETALVFVGRYIWLGYKEQTVEDTRSQGFAPLQTVFGWDVHSRRSFLQQLVEQ